MDLFKTSYIKYRKTFKIGIRFLIIGVLFWQFGFFTRFNYLTAKIDIWRDSPRIVSCGRSLYPCGVPCISLKEKYGFHESNISCVVTTPQIRGIKLYNAQIIKYLNKKNGEDWQKEYHAEMELLIKNNMLE
ncbi:FEKKY domain-containing protein [Tenacibaculum agarivorans]|uniref:FEKKY domain-containing protein n=1 Tax=Tenacibaculum agarivorans TaxID=1908389 RepID=UPI00094B928E|nr:hypothetical protein [Tenacibaculum agarivorans]